MRSFSNHTKFRRDFESDVVITVFNVSAQPQKITLNVTGANGKLFREALSGKESTVRNAALQIELAPRSAAIWE